MKQSLQTRCILLPVQNKKIDNLYKLYLYIHSLSLYIVV